MNAERLLGNLIKGAVGSALGGRRSGLDRMMRGSGSAVGMGLLGLAVGAFEHFSQQQTAPTGAGAPPAAPSGGAMPPPLPGAPQTGASRSVPPPPPRAASAPNDATLLVRAMIAAAYADGKIDPAEEAKILERAGEDRAFVENELRTPLGLEELVAQALVLAPSQEQRDQVYFVSLLAIRADTAEEQRYLQALAERLAVTPAQRNEWHELFGMPPVF